MNRYRLTAMKVECPVCAGKEARLLWASDSKQAAQNFVLKERDPQRFMELVSYIEYLWGQSTCEVVQCDQCEFCFSNPYIAGDERFYELAYERSGYPSWNWEFQLTRDELVKIARPEHTLLEIGAGDGAFVRQIAQGILPKENITCTEFSKYGRGEINKLGIKCISDHVQELSMPDLKESFNFVCMFQVLEHMDKLDLVFQKLNWLMKKGGSLFIAVPNPGRIQFNELNGALLDMPPNHIGRWNKKCFEIVSRRNGFYLEKHDIEEWKFTPAIKQLSVYRFLRKSQQSGAIDNRISKIRNRRLLRAIQIIGVAFNLVLALPLAAKMDSETGNSQWVHLIKL